MNEQVPREPVTSHRSHTLSQAELQQTPSTQLPEVHSRQMPCCATLQSLMRLQALPRIRCGVQVPATLQNVPVPHSLSLVQDAGHVPCEPLHMRFPEQEVVGAFPEGSSVQMPLGIPVREAAALAADAAPSVHTSHDPEQALAQQTPSEQVYVVAQYASAKHDQPASPVILKT